MHKTFLTNVDVLDGDTPLRKGLTIVFVGDEIAFVGPAALAPQRDSADEVRDLAGKTVLPGMISGHFHAPFHNVGSETGVPLQTTPPVLSGYRALANAQTALFCGFTTVVSAGCNDAIDPQLKSAIDAGLAVGPRMVPCSRDTLSSADNIVPWWIDNRGEWGIGRCDGPDEMRKHVREEMNRGAQLIKLTVSGGHALPQQKGTRMFNDAEVRAAVETAHDRGARVRTHVTGRDAILACIAAGVDILDHCDDMDDECIEAMVKADVFVLPSIYQTSRLVALKAEFFGINMAELEAEFNWMCGILPKAVQAGVKLCVGDDFGTSLIPHGDYAREMAMYVTHAGIAPLEVLRWATKNGAGLAAMPDIGAIAPGKRADMVVLDGDPSADITLLCDRANIAAVISRGRFVTDDAALRGIAPQVREYQAA